MSVRSLTLLLSLFSTGPVVAEPLTLPLDQRPEWVRRDGIVMAGSWEPLLFRVRRDGAKGYTPTAEQRAAYEREHSPEMVARLKALGVNFVMTHCYKGAGLGAERAGMADAVRFAKLCHDAGLRIGVYNYSGAFLWEPLFKETPEAKDWVLLDGHGEPLTYGRATYRYRWNRNHPDAQAFYRKIVRFAVQDIRSDLLHFDNYTYGPGRDANSVQRFRRHLRERFGPEQLQKMGVTDVATVMPPMDRGRDDLLWRLWADFCCQSLADSYHDMARYARTLRKDVLIECNPGGAEGVIRPPVDHGRLLQGGEAFWSEGGDSGYRKGQLHSRIRTYKIARRMNNLCFAYTRKPLEMAEAMAFNLDCLGCICWFEYAKLSNYPGSWGKPIIPATAPYVRFFHKRRDLLRDAAVVADVAVLRSFPSQVFADPKVARLTHRVEQVLIDGNACFQIIYNQHLGDLKRYRALVLAGCAALSDGHAELIRRYVGAGGRLCVIGPLATHDEWMLPRERPALNDLPAERVVRIDASGDVLAAVRRACGGAMSLSVRVHTEPSRAKPPTVAVGAKLYTDRDYTITRVPKELVGVGTIRFSHTRAKGDASLRFEAKVPVRVFVAFGPRCDTDQWLDPQPGWKLYKASAFGCSARYIDGADIHVRDFAPGRVTLFEGQKGNVALLGIQPRSLATNGVVFVAERPTTSSRLCTEVTDQQDRRLVHFVNYRSDGPVKGITTHLRLPVGHKVKSVSLASPDWQQDLALPYEEKPETVTFTVPEVAVYEIAVVRWLSTPG